MEVRMEIEAYEYTAGPLGDRWLNEIKQGRLTVAKCPSCNTIFLPPKLYCPKCRSRVVDLIQLGKGKVEYMITVGVDDEGKELDHPAKVAIIRFPNTFGGLVHYVSDDVEEGDEVLPEFREERRGSITDIVRFRKA